MKYDILLLNSRNILLSEKSMDIQQINQEIWYFANAESTLHTTNIL